jgi:predicted hydrocarbon binding protein
MQRGAQQKFKGFFKPLNVGRIMSLGENKKIYGLVIESKIERGALNKLCDLIENLGVMLRFVQFSMEKVSTRAVTAIGFLDFSHSKASPEQFMKLLRRQKFIKNAQLINPSNSGIVYDNYFFPLVLENERVITAGRTVYEALFNGIRKKFGAAGETMLYYQGFSVGFEVYNEYMSIAKSERIEDLIEVSKAVNMTLGWGIIDKVKINWEKGTAKYRVYNNFECELAGKSEKPYSQFYRGAVAGLFTRFFEREIKVKETKCIAKGDSYCEFVIKIQ